MNVDEAWRQFGDIDVFPEEALTWTLANWDAASSRLIAKLRAHASGAKLSDDDVNALYFVVHLCAEKHDERAYAPLCAILERNDEAAGWLDDTMGETLPCVLISLSDGDVEPLKRVYESAAAHELARWSALLALAYLARAKGALSDDDMRAYLSETGAKSSRQEPEMVVTAWAMAVGMLGYESMSAEVARAFSRSIVDNEIFDLKDFHRDLTLARSSPDGLAAFHNADIAPFKNLLETLRPYSGSPAAGAGGDPAGDAGALRPYVNPMREVGRNDPCPCGSGKKYKKCCLPA